MKWLITALVSIILSEILEGVHFDSFLSAVIFAIVLSLLNITIKPILKIVGLPLNIITLGLFSLVINTIIILIADNLIQGMQIDGFMWALLFSVLLSAVTSIFVS